MGIGFGYNGWAMFNQESAYGVPAAGTNAQQTLTPGGDLTGGHFDIAINGISLLTVVYNVTLVALNALLLATFGSVNIGGTVVQNVLASGGTFDAGTAFTITYQGIYGSKPMPNLTFTPHSITGSTVTVASSVTGLVASNVYKEILDESIELKQEQMEKPTLGDVSILRSVHSKSSTEGVLKFQMQFNDVERLLYNAFGAIATADHSGETTVYDHTITLAKALPGSLSVWVDRDSGNLGSQFLYPGCMIDKLKLSQEVENFLICEASLVGSGQEILVYPQAKPTPHAFNGIDYEMVLSGNVTVNGVTIPAKMAELELDNGLSKERYLLGSNLRTGLQRGAVRKVTGKITLEFQSTAQILLFENYTSFAVVFAWTGQNVAGSAGPTPYSLTLTMPYCRLKGKTPNVKDWNVIQQDLEFQAFGSSGSDEISAVLTNDVNAYT